MWQTLVVGPLSEALRFIAQSLAAVGIPYAWGFAIVAFTLIIKLITLPLAIRQTESTKKMQELQPQLQALQKKYAGNKEKLAQEQMNLYREAGVNPMGGCLPSLIQLPVWIGLYQALISLANAGLLTGGFLWIPDLSFPNTQVGTQWLWPGGSAWAGWGHLAAYLVLPILTVVTQLVTQKLMSPPSSGQSQGAMNSAMMFMPFMFGFFALTFPSGLALYWVTNNVFTMIQQYLLGGMGTRAVAGVSSGKAAEDEQQGAVPAAGEAGSESPRVPRQTPRKRTRNGRKRRRS
ncbi:MAG: YidC/Oxa1 family membrane protein insertase [Anaerolineae bacterium]|nr:YidC/Oxa1 family membrane protein insertase [Anaerolineae bacterium]